VEGLAQTILDFIEQEKLDEKERDHVISFAYPQKYANILIGKRGESINKYREEFDVDIQVSEGKVDIKGPKAKGETAKAKILGLAKRLEDEATHVLKIKPQYHRDLIGMKGSQVNRLQERYNVRVNFPRNNNPTTEDDQSVADTMSEVGSGRRMNRPQQAADEVIIRGPRKGADEAREELLSLLQWTMDHSYSGSVSVARSQLPMLIGQGGREMESLRLATGAQIDVPDNKRDGSDSSPRADIKLKGTKEQVEDAKKLLEQRAKAFDDTVTRTIEVDKRHHKAIIGGGGKSGNLNHF
jgi:predicted PilT family ATPase